MMVGFTKRLSGRVQPIRIKTNLSWNDLVKSYRERGYERIGGLNKTPNGVVIGVVQLQLPVVATPSDLSDQAQRIVEMVGKARRNMVDLVVFPEYALHGLSMSTDPAIMCTLDGPEVAAFRLACATHRIWGCFSVMELNPRGNPYNSGIIIDDRASSSSTTGRCTPGCRSNPGTRRHRHSGGNGPNGSKIATHHLP